MGGKFDDGKNIQQGQGIHKGRGLGKTSGASSPHERTKTTGGQARSESAYPGGQFQYKLLRELAPYFQSYAQQAVRFHESPLFFEQVTGLLHSTTTPKRASPNADVSALEIEIDRLVYQLYDLTPTEITAVENI